MIGFMMFLAFNLNSQDTKTNLSIELTSSIEKLNGKFIVNNIKWARIENPQLPQKSSIGMFTEPPNMKLPFDISFVVAELTGKELGTGNYMAVKVINDIPQFTPGINAGFMTIVVNNSEIPKDEYYSTAGRFTLTKTTENEVTGEFEITLQSNKNSKQMNAKGNFYIKL